MNAFVPYMCSVCVLHTTHTHIHTQLAHTHTQRDARARAFPIFHIETKAVESICAPAWHTYMCGWFINERAHTHTHKLMCRGKMRTVAWKEWWWRKKNTVTNYQFCSRDTKTIGARSTQHNNNDKKKTNYTDNQQQILDIDWIWYILCASVCCVQNAWNWFI